MDVWGDEFERMCTQATLRAKEEAARQIEVAKAAAGKGGGDEEGCGGILCADVGVYPNLSGSHSTLIYRFSPLHGPFALQQQL